MEVRRKCNKVLKEKNCQQGIVCLAKLFKNEGEIKGIPRKTKAQGIHP